MTVEISKNINNDKQSKDINIFRYAIVIEYNGKDFAGSQKQLNQRTVQSEIENALRTVTKLNIKTYFSGRTDRGVHSQGQVAHFDITYKLDYYKFIHSINGVLPSDICILAIKEVDGDFHSQKSALFRWYRYKILNRKQRSVWMDDMLHIHDKLDLDKMNLALSYLNGYQDFSCFKNANSANPYTDCTIYLGKCTKESDIVYVDLVANRFLYNMVRIIVGTLIDIGQAKYSPEHIKVILNSKNRINAGKTVSSKGLTFMYVGYNKEYNIYDGLNKEAIYNENLLCKAS